MTSINKLTQNKSANADDLVPIWDSENRRTRSLSLQSISEFVETSDGKYIASGLYKDGKLTLNYSDGGSFTVSGFVFKSTQLKDMPVSLQPGKTLVVNQSGDGYELADSAGSENVTEGSIPQKGSDSFVDSPMSVDESGIKTPGSFTADELITNISSLNLGHQKKIVGIGEGVGIHDLSIDKHNFIITQELDKEEDTRAYQYKQEEYQLINIQPEFDTTLQDPEFTFTTQTGNQILYGFEFKVNTTQNNCVAQIFRSSEVLSLGSDAKPIWQDKFSNVQSDVLQRIDAVILDGQTDYTFKITGEFLGNTEGKMYYSIGFRLATKQNLIGTESGLNVESVVAGNQIYVNNDDPSNPIVSWAPGGEFLPGVNVSQGGKPVENAANTLDFSDDQFLLTTNNKGQVQIELGNTTPSTNVVGLFESTTELLAEYPNPADGLYAYVLQGEGKYPDDRYESLGGQWIGMGGITGETVVDDVKYKSLILGSGLKAEDDLGGAKISLDGNTPVFTFDVTTDSTRSVDAFFTGKTINIIQTPPLIDIPMEITLVDHSEFKTGDTIKISADRDSDNAYKNYYFAVFYNDSNNRQLAKYPANNITMIRTQTSWDVQLDGRYTNVSIRPKPQFDIPYAPNEQYNTPVNAIVFAESASVGFEVDENTSNRIVKVDLDSLTENYTLKSKFDAKSGYDDLVSSGGSTKTITYSDNAKILKLTNSTVKVEMLQSMSSDSSPQGYFKYINAHNDNVDFEWYDRNGNRITNNVPSVCPRDAVIEVFADYAKDQYALSFSQTKAVSSTVSDSQNPVSKNFINVSNISVDYPTNANGEQYRPNNVIVMVLDTSNMISGLNINVTSSDSYAGHYNSVGAVCINDYGEWSLQSNFNAYRLNDGTNTYCVFSKSSGSWVLVVADVDHNNNGSLVGGSPINLYNDGQLPESYGDYLIQNDLESIESEYFTQADVDIDYYTNSDANSYFNVSFGSAKPAGVIFYK